MAFKQNPNRKPRLEELSKAALIKTVKVLQRRETKLLNQIAALQHELEKPSIVVVELRNRLERVAADLIEHGHLLPPAVYRDMRAAASGVKPDFGGPGDPLNDVGQDDAANANDTAIATSTFPWE